MEKIELKWRRRGRKNISCMWNTWRFIMSRIKRIKANGKLLHNGGGERVHKHTFFPSVCVYERVCMWVCASPKCELRDINIIFQYVQPLRIRVYVLSRAKVVVKQMCAFYVSFLFFFFFYFFFVSCFRFLPPFLSHSLSLSVRYELVCVCVWVCVPETICRYGVWELQTNVANISGRTKKRVSCKCTYYAIIGGFSMFIFMYMMWYCASSSLSSLSKCIAQNISVRCGKNSTHTTQMGIYV